jgi:plasmid stabilization system protein ParE
LPEVLFSRRSELDLESIDDYTADKWGDAQADLYLSQLKSFFKLLAVNPGLGRHWKENLLVFDAWNMPVT